MTISLVLFMTFVLLYGGYQLVLQRNLWRSRRMLEEGRVSYQLPSPNSRTLHGRFRGRDTTAYSDLNGHKTLEIEAPCGFYLNVVEKKPGNENNDSLTRFSISSNDDTIPGLFPHSEKAVRLLHRVFDTGAVRLFVQDGRLRCQYSSRTISNPRFFKESWLNAQLSRLAELVEVLIQLTLEHVREKLGELLKDVLCPYCRDDLLAGIDQPAVPDLVACRGCGTTHHQSCWQENGGCTIFGCNAGPGEHRSLRVGGIQLKLPPRSEA